MSCGFAVRRSRRRFLGAVVPRSEQVLVLCPVGEATGDVPFLEGLGIANATVEEMIGIGEAADNRADQDELANQVGILEREVDGKLAAMGTADKNRMPHFSTVE